MRDICKSIFVFVSQVSGFLPTLNPRRDSDLFEPQVSGYGSQFDEFWADWLNAADILDAFDHNARLYVSDDVLSDSDASPGTFASDSLRHCIPGSMINHNTSLGFTAVTSDGGFSVQDARFGLFMGEGFLSVPPALDQYLCDKLIAAGATTILLSNCTTQLINRLPTLDLHLTGGLLRFPPSDLFSVHPENNTCTPTYSVATEGNSVIVDPFNIPGVYSWIEDPNLFLCDQLF